MARALHGRTDGRTDGVSLTEAPVHIPPIARLALLPLLMLLLISSHTFAGCPSRPASGGLGKYAAPNPAPIQPSAGRLDHPFVVLSREPEGGAPVGLVSTRTGALAFAWHFGGGLALAYASDAPGGFSLIVGAPEETRVELSADEKEATLFTASGHSVGYAWSKPPAPQIGGYDGRTYRRLSAYPDGFGSMGRGANEMVVFADGGRRWVHRRFPGAERGPGKTYLLTRIEGPGQRLTILDRDDEGRVLSATVDGRTLVGATVAAAPDGTEVTYTRSGARPVAALTYGPEGLLAAVGIYRLGWRNAAGEAVPVSSRRDFSVSYDAQGRLAGVAPAEGAPLLAVQYDGGGRAVEVRTPAAKYTYTYEDLPEGLRVEVAYESQGGAEESLSIPSHAVAFYPAPPAARREAEVLGCDSVTDCAGSTRTKCWDAYGNLVTYTDKNGNTTRYTYAQFGEDEIWKLVSMVTPLGGTWTWGYDADGNQNYERDPEGTEHLWEFDANGNATAHRERYTASPTLGVVQRVESWTYEPVWPFRVAAHTDFGGHVTLYDWVISCEGDDCTTVLTQTDPMGFVETTAYWPGEADPDSIRVTRPSGTTWAYLYAVIGNLPGKQLQAVYIPSEGQQLDVNPLFQSWYKPSAGPNLDFLQRDNRCTDHFPNLDDCGGTVEPTSFKLWGWDGPVEKIRDPMAYDTVFSFVNYPQGTKATSRRRYDNRFPCHDPDYPDYPRWEHHNPCQGAIAPTLHRYDKYGYSCRGDLVREEVDADTDGHTGEVRLVTTYTYDGNHNVVTKTDSYGHTTTYTYDAENNLEAITYPDGRAESFGYDALGRLVLACGLDAEVTYTYDGFGRVAGVFTAVGEREWSESYAYDPDDNRLGFYSLDGDVTYEYDANHRVTSVTDGEGLRTSFAYASCCGNLETVAFPNNTITRYGWDPRGQLTSVVTSNRNEAQVRSVNYTLDQKTGLRTAKVREDPAYSEYYEYNDRLELAAVRPAPGSVAGEVYRYDARGNRYRREVHTGTSVALESFTYDGADRLTARSAPDAVTTYRYGAGTRGTAYEVAAERVFAGSAQAEVALYDHRGRMAGYTRHGEISGGATYDLWAELKYLPDGLGRLGSLSQDELRRDGEATEWGSRRVTYLQDFLDTYRQEERVERQRDFPGGSTEVREVARDYLLGPGVDNWLTLRTEDPESGEVTGRYSFARDGLNSTLALLGPSGTVAEAYEYDAWGNLLTPEPQINFFTYTGREWDPILEQYNYRARVYDPRLGRFGSEDPEGSAPNSHYYVGNMPTNLLDPLGLNATGKVWGQACGSSTTSLATCQLCCANLQSDEITDCIGMVVGGLIFSAVLAGSLAVTPGAPAGIAVLGVGLSASFGYGAGCYAYVNSAGNYCDKTCAVKYD